MKKTLFLLAMFCALEINAQNYYISFTGTGASGTVGSVKVENLTAATSLIVNSGYRLSLTFPTGVNTMEDKQSSELKIYPNPSTGNSFFRVYPPSKGDATISVYDINGKPVYQLHCNLERDLQEFLISGLKIGFYVVNVKGNSYQYSGKLVSNAESSGKISIEKVNNSFTVSEKPLKSDTKGVQETKVSQPTVDMTYTDGDRLKFTGISGIYSTVVVDIPTSNKTINFNFIACTDGSGNNYPVVDIGGQIWMAENLKTTTYSDVSSTPIPNKTVSAEWTALTTGAYSDYSNTPANSDTYGRLYNWFTVDNNAATKVASNGGKNVCPTGWHIPSDAEWTVLTDYLTNNGYGYQGSGNDIGKSMASTSGWNTSAAAGTVGNDPASSNSSGFTALPGGTRYLDGSYDGVGDDGSWWTSTEHSTTISAWYWQLAYSNTTASSSYNYKQSGVSVRCVKD